MSVNQVSWWHSKNFLGNDQKPQLLPISNIRIACTTILEETLFISSEKIKEKGHVLRILFAAVANIIVKDARL